MELPLCSHYKIRVCGKDLNLLKDIFNVIKSYPIINSILRLMSGLPKIVRGGGMSRGSPLYILIVIQIYNVWYILESLWVLLKQSAKKIANLPNFKYLLQVIKVKNLQKQKVRFFEQPIDAANSNICNIFKNLICIQGRLKMCIFSLEAPVLKSMQNFFAKLVQSVSFCSRLFEYLQCRITKTESRSKDRFSLVKVK